MIDSRDEEYENESGVGRKLIQRKIDFFISFF